MECLSRFTYKLSRERYDHRSTSYNLIKFQSKKEFLLVNTMIC